MFLVDCTCILDSVSQLSQSFEFSCVAVISDVCMFLCAVEGREGHGLAIDVRANAADQVCLLLCHNQLVVAVTCIFSWFRFLLNRTLARWAFVFLVSQ